MPLNTNELIQEVRNQIDEDSDVDITDAHILASLNRAMTSGYNTMANVFPDPLVTFVDVIMTATGQLTLPEGIFEDRILHVDHLYSNIWRRLTPETYQGLHNYTTTTTTSWPEVWAVTRRELLIKPLTSAGVSLRLWYVQTPEKLVKPQGRITRIGSDYFVVDSYGEGLSTDADELNSYFNVIGFNKGDIKWTGQVKTITGDKIQHKSTASRTSVLNQTVSTDQSEASPTITQDDYICEVGGTCIPYMPTLLENLVMQSAVVDMLDRLGHDSTMARQTLSYYNKKLEKNWTGRPARTKVALTSNQWSSGRGRRNR